MPYALKNVKTFLQGGADFFRHNVSLAVLVRFAGPKFEGVFAVAGHNVNVRVKNDLTGDSAVVHADVNPLGADIFLN